MEKYIKMITAQEAYETAVKKLKETDISQEIEDIMSAIQLVSEKGGLVVPSAYMNVDKAELLSITLSNHGYNAYTASSNQVKDNILQCYVVVNWKHLPTNSRESYAS